jgi:hypothetical protein
VIHRPVALSLMNVLLVALLGVLLAAGPASGQVEMPDARQMSGIPRPVDDLPDRVISVRLIRGSLSNNIPDHPVELLINGRSETVRTGEDGRAQFGPLAAGAKIKAVAVVDGERMESQEFTSPSRGGVRLMLVATDKAGSPSAATEPMAAPVVGEVVLAGDSRIVMETAEESVRVYYLLDIVNNARTPVNPARSFSFETPTGAQGTTVMEGSSTRASASGPVVRVEGPFPPGTTSVEVGFALPALRGTIDIEQRFPVTLERLAVIAEQSGGAQLSSPQIERQQDMPVGERVYIAAAGRSVPAGELLVLSLTGLPHHSSAPRLVALTLAGAIVLVGFWAARKSVVPAPPERGPKRLIARREKLFQELVRLELDRQRGVVQEARYAERRRDIIATLEQIYGALDSDDTTPEPTRRPDLAA